MFIPMMAKVEQVWPYATRGADSASAPTLVNDMISGHLSGPATCLDGVSDERDQRQLFHLQPVDTQPKQESP
jgi:hypothetical protein